MPVVLHADDNAANRYLVRQMMAMAAYEVVEAWPLRWAGTWSATGSAPASV